MIDISKMTKEEFLSRKDIRIKCTLKEIKEAIKIAEDYVLPKCDNPIKMRTLIKLHLKNMNNQNRNLFIIQISYENIQQGYVNVYTHRFMKSMGFFMVEFKDVRKLFHNESKYRWKR